MTPPSFVSHFAQYWNTRSALALVLVALLVVGALWFRIMTTTTVARSKPTLQHEPFDSNSNTDAVVGAATDGGHGSAPLANTTASPATTTTTTTAAAATSPLSNTTTAAPAASYTYSSTPTIIHPPQTQQLITHPATVIAIPMPSTCHSNLQHAPSICSGSPGTNTGQKNSLRTEIQELREVIGTLADTLQQQMPPNNSSYTAAADAEQDAEAQVTVTPQFSNRSSATVTVEGADDVCSEEDQWYDDDSCTTTTTTNLDCPYTVTY
jgi:hypothetical protein